MAENIFFGLFIKLFLASCILPIKGRDISKLLGGEYKVELDGTQIGDAISNKLSGSSTLGFPKIKAASDDGYTHDVQPLSESLAYIGATNNLFGTELVAAGVHVYPRMYNNSDLRFFTYWTDGAKSCYNDNCPGFVIANGSNLLPGEALAPLSDYGGNIRYITIRIKKDEKTGDWSLYREDKGGPIGGMTLLGWWPKNLFNSLSDYANIIQWTGEVTYQQNETGPSMGSGQFSDDHDRGKAASFYGLYGFDNYGTIYNNEYNPIPFADKPECYNLSPWYDPSFSSREKTHFFYGGPSGCSQ
ncbi:hypothetical protein LUZ63_002383 [Rhynchospora breviuscula]|uniref:Neprosin PEP catalytic domain-containing protein n=1 Tax=Rhynchospora breviuscula TaxID=2022672 RepID=A0A9Q0D000_9POAL|nr:hypothetical protein LUZ63_002383 [Rhynchospora breviuscula]